jgi:hypothetical protein
MPWYIHFYHAAWLILVVQIGLCFGWGYALAVLGSIVFLALRYA